MTRVLIIVQDLPVPFDRRVWLDCQVLVSGGYQVAVVCPKGDGDPPYAVVDSDDESGRSRMRKLGRAGVEQELARSHQPRSYLDVYRSLTSRGTTLGRTRG